MSEKSSLGHLPAEARWRFDESVTACFEDMLRRSIPQIAAMRGVVTDLATRFAHVGGTIVDLGASRGDAAAPIIERLGGALSYHLIEVSDPMIEVLRQRFSERELQHLPAVPTVVVEKRDLREPLPSFDDQSVNVVLSVLTLQFVPIEHRQRIVDEVYEILEPGGAFVLVEKVLGDGSRLNSQMVNAYHRLKMANGYSKEEIEQKRLSLEGVLVPVTAGWNEQMLRQAGFAEVDCAWRWMNFGAWVGVKL